MLLIFNQMLCTETQLRNGIIEYLEEENKTQILTLWCYLIAVKVLTRWPINCEVSEMTAFDHLH